MRVILALHLGKAELIPVFLTKKIPEGHEIGMVNPYTFTSWRTLKAIPNLFYCITVFMSLGVGSFFNLLKENSMNVCLKSDMGLKKKLLAPSLAWKISLSSGQSETYSHSLYPLARKGNSDTAC